MARIRTLKPEILEDAVTAGLSDSAFRLFVSAIVLADDHGNLQGDERWLRSQIWWAHDRPPRFAEIRGELRRARLVIFYTVRGQQYLHLNGWEKHQRIDNAGKPRVPRHDDSEATEIVDFEDARGNPRRNSANRGEIPLDPDPDLDLDPEGDREADFAAVAAKRPPDGPVSRLWQLQEQLRSEVIPNCRALKPSAKRLARVAKILADGNTESDAEAVLRSIANRVRAEPAQGQWFNGETNWRAENFDRELGRVGTLVLRPGMGLSTQDLGDIADELERQGR